MTLHDSADYDVEDYDVEDHDTASYDPLALIYDRLQEDIDYEAWAAWFDREVRRSGATDQTGDEAEPMTWLDLGCGTGTLLLALASYGYDLIGMDRSSGMLTEARQKFDELQPEREILLLKQDITSFLLPEPVHVCSIVLDTINHLPGPEAVRSLLRSCYDALVPGGLLIFDVMSEHHARENLGDRQFFVMDEDYALFWDNSYDEAGRISTAELSLFEEDPYDGRYVRHELVIEEQIYSDLEIRDLLEEAGFCKLRSRAPLGDKQASEEEDRVFYFSIRN